MSVSSCTVRVIKVKPLPLFPTFYADKTEGIFLPELDECPACRSLSGMHVPSPSISLLLRLAPSDSFITVEGSDADTSIRGA